MDSNAQVEISIIVPVYNVEKYLERCLKSLISQTFENYEIILIDDGSSDNSGKICDDYAKRYEKIRVIHQKNAGLSAARNVGIKQSIAPYILFVDSDDTIDEFACEKLYETMMKENVEIVRANSIIVKEEKFFPEKKKNVISGKVYNGLEFLVRNIQNGTMSMCAPYSLYKKDIIEKSNLFFKEGILHEDELWTPQIYLEASKVVWLDYDFYYHYIRENSITQAKNKSRNANDLINICFTLYKRYEKLDKENRRILNDYLCMLYLNAVFIGRIYDANKRFPLKTAYSLTNKIKSVFYGVSPRLYCKCNEIVKRSLFK